MSKQIELHPVSQRKNGALWSALIILLTIAAVRIRLLGDIEIGVDEAWSIWQGMGTVPDILRWTPYDWPPLYYLLLAFWRKTAGADPIVLRYLSVLVFVPGVAALMPVVRRWSSRPAAGLLSMLAYSALGYSMFLTTELRGYAVIMGLLPLAFWATLRYFERSSLLRGISLGLLLTLMFYTTFTSAIAFVMMGLFTIIVYGRRIWRWWLPVLILIALAAPLIISKVGLAVSRTDATRGLILAPFGKAITTLFAEFSGIHVWGWLILLVLATGLIVWVVRPMTRTGWALLAWWLGGAVTLYVLNPWLGFFSPRYGWWLMLGFALWLGWGLSEIPFKRMASASMVVVSGALLLFMFTPGDLFKAYQIVDPPLVTNLRWLADHSQPGDVVVLDPNVDCGSANEWAYLTEVLIPDGPAFSPAPNDYRRVWYVQHDSHQDPTLYADVKDGRIAREFVGPAICLFRLYEGPPDAGGILFENGMRFHGIEALDAPGPIVTRHEGEALTVRLWWSVDESPEADYSISMQFTNSSGELVQQQDSGPQVIDGPGETSHWEPGQFYVEERTITMPFPMHRENLDLYLVVYQWWDGVRIPAPGVTDDTRLPLIRVHVAAW